MESMKRKITLCVVLVLVISLVCLSGCSLFGNSTDDIAKQQSTSYSSSADYQAIIASLKEALQQATASNQANIGAYASVYTNCLLNITCTEGSSSVQGTGFIITKDGYVLTNNHVVTYDMQVEDRDKIIGYRNYYYGGRLEQVPVYGTKTVNYVYSSVVGSFDNLNTYGLQTSTHALEVLYTDPAYDLALCKLTETAPEGGWECIPFYEVGNNGVTAMRGDQLLVLGNARGFGLSATSGLVSATGKKFTDYPALTFIQTDAAINGGNSGGPAINIYGGLVGVVNSKFVSVIKSSYFSSEIEDVEGMGFAIELACVKTFIRAAEESKNVTVSYKTVSAPQGQTAQPQAA
ncbi:MAG TPA: hypothetical protein DIC18_01150 [Clostridiales bacterium]|nr:hypothetical protein [Clostridiales bacterium]